MKKQILCEKVVKKWLESIKNTGKQTTFDRYQCVTRLFIAELGSKEIGRITGEDLNLFLTKCQSKGWSYSSLMMSLGIIRKIIMFAKQNGYVTELEFRPVKIKKNSSKVKALTLHESKIINSSLSAVKRKGDLAILIALNTGLRVGEVCSLRWKDIDLKRRMINVSGTVHRVKCTDCSSKTKLELHSPKTVSSKREVPISGFLCSILAKYTAEDEVFVISCSAEKIPEPRSIQRHFSKFCNSTFGEKISFHCLRHTFATLAISKGVDVKTVSEILGHASIVTTMNIYRNVSFEDKTQAVNILEKYITPKVKKQKVKASVKSA